MTINDCFHVIRNGLYPYLFKITSRAIYNHIYIEKTVPCIPFRKSIYMYQVVLFINYFSFYGVTFDVLALNVATFEFLTPVLGFWAQLKIFLFLEITKWCIKLMYSYCYRSLPSKYFWCSVCVSLTLATFWT